MEVAKRKGMHLKAFGDFHRKLDEFLRVKNKQTNETLKEYK